MGEGKEVSRTLPAATPILMTDITLNDSDKSFTVPAGKRYYVRSVYAHMAATATVGNRLMVLVINDGTNDILTLSNWVNQTATQTVYWLWSPSVPKNTSIVNGAQCQVCMPNELTLPAGYVLRVYDSAAVDAAADDMKVALVLEVLDV